MATVGTFCLYKNEAVFIRPHILSWVPHVDEMVIYDGNSTDGTVEIVKDIQKNHPFGSRIKLFENKDPKDLTDDYVRVFDECLHALSTNFAAFTHGDMILEDPGNIGFLGDAIAYYSTMRSFAGEPGGQLYEIKSGRSPFWKNIYRLRSPDLGLHYHGHYGHVSEDCYFSKITGAEHIHVGDAFEQYPYEVKDSGVKIAHYSDVRAHERRAERMFKCLINQGKPAAEALRLLDVHPRVTLKDGFNFKFEPVDTPDFLKQGATA